MHTHSIDPPSCMTLRNAAAVAARREPAARSLLQRVVDTLICWSERSRARHEMAELDDHMLRDIGADRSQILLESQKPFWRA